MNANDTEAAGMNPETVTNDLTQLSSREQLSALMDGALPADQTRFLLRRLQHDAPLAECWERWRLTGEVMRGLAPTQRLPADFAGRVSASLHGGAVSVRASRSTPTPGWLRWGGSAAVAASLAVVALMAQQPVADAPAAAASVQVASSPASSRGISDRPAPVSGVQMPLEAGSAAQTLAAASVAAVASSRPARSRDRARSSAAARVQSVAVRNDVIDAQTAAAVDGMLDTGTVIPQPDIVTRPWPRSVLPQYASGALAVGFGAHAQASTAYNPFKSQPGLGSLRPLANPAAGEAAATRETPGAGRDEQREAQAEP